MSNKSSCVWTISINVYTATAVESVNVDGNTRAWLQIAQWSGDNLSLLQQENQKLGHPKNPVSDTGMMPKSDLGRYDPGKINVGKIHSFMTVHIRIYHMAACLIVHQVGS